MMVFHITRVLFTTEGSKHIGKIGMKGSQREQGQKLFYGGKWISGNNVT